MFNAFSEHILHRLQVKQNLPEKNKRIRITFLSRGTKYRKVLNEDELIKKITSNGNYVVERVNFGRNISFKDQLKISCNTDVFVGLHGAGLTHLLFLPKWASLFELYNCEDNCYKDLARLRGVNYLTWENTTMLESIDAGYEQGDHEKFKNYRFDVNEFERLVNKAADNVQENTDYKKFLTTSQHDEL